MEKDISTEERIKEAARKIFLEKGFGATRTREIAEAAGINSALLNYYFRSKEKLFEIIMMESVQEMFAFIFEIVQSKTITLSQKIDKIISHYIDIFLRNPNLPLFVLNEIQSNPERFMQRSTIPHDALMISPFYLELKEHLDKKNIDIIPLHFFVNMISMSIMPVIAKPIVGYLHKMNEEQYIDFIEERRKFIPMWVKSTLKLDE
jgi:AcrR family transcriptional regulator